MAMVRPNSFDGVVSRMTDSTQKSSVWAWLSSLFTRKKPETPSQTKPVVATPVPQSVAEKADRASATVLKRIPPKELQEQARVNDLINAKLKESAKSPIPVHPKDVTGKAAKLLAGTVSSRPLASSRVLSDDNKDVKKAIKEAIKPEVGSSMNFNGMEMRVVADPISGTRLELPTPIEVNDQRDVALAKRPGPKIGTHVVHGNYSWTVVSDKHGGTKLENPVPL